MSRMKTLSEIQDVLDNIYGEGVWTILSYQGGQKPCILQHKCGELKIVKFAKNIKNGKLLCVCDPTPEPLRKLYEKMKVKKDDLQKDIDNIYGEGEWIIIDFNGMSSPLTLKHSCGQPKTISRASNIRKGTCTCKCELKGNQK